jgi:hypothetical protein
MQALNVGGAERRAGETWSTPTMNVRISLDEESQPLAEAKAAQMGMTIEDYIRRLVSDDLGRARQKVDMSVFFDLVTDGPPSDIARDKDKMIAEAVWEDHARGLLAHRAASMRETGLVSPFIFQTG